MLDKTRIMVGVVDPAQSEHWLAEEESQRFATGISRT